MRTLHEADPVRAQPAPAGDRGGGAPRAARYLGALAVAGTGALHLEQYLGASYRDIPTIGPLFLANFIVAVALALALLAPVERLARALPELLALAGIGVAGLTIAGLLVSESSSLFGFHEHGYRTAIVLSLVLEGAAIVLLALFVALAARRAAPGRARAPRSRARPGAARPLHH